jgi:MFS family permease
MKNTYNRKLVFSAACIGMLLFGIVLITLGSILPSVTKQFELDEMETGYLISILPFAILSGSIIFGPIVDKYGYKNLLIICSALVLGGFEGIAFADSIFMLQLSIFLIGFGGGVINGGTNALVSDISSEYKGANLSLLGVFFGIGALGMPVILGLLSNYFEYNILLSLVGIAIIFPMLFFLTIKFPEPKQQQGLPLRKSLEFIKDKMLLLIAMFLFFQSAVEGIVNNWTTTFLQTEKLTSNENSLYALSIFVTGIAVGRLLLGSVLKKVSLRITIIVSLVVSQIGIIIIMFSIHFPATLFGLILLGFGFAAGFPIMLGIVGEIYSSISGTAFSFVFTIALIGNMILNYLTGILAHSYNVRAFTVIIAISIAIMFVLQVIIFKKFSNLNRKG